MGGRAADEDTLTRNPVKIEFLTVDPELGRMCKRIIDFCRCRCSGARGNESRARKEGEKRFSVEMVYYCEPEDSPENCLILGSVVWSVS